MPAGYAPAGRRPDGVQIHIANLLDAISDGADIDTVRAQANELARAYLDARTRDHDKH